MNTNLNQIQMHYEFSQLKDFEILKEFVEACDMAFEQLKIKACDIAFEQLKTDRDLIKICLMTNHIEFRNHFNQDFKTLLNDLLPSSYLDLFFLNSEKSKIMPSNPKNYIDIKNEKFDVYAEYFREFSQNFKKNKL
jgi:hypothetical protein